MLSNTYAGISTLLYCNTYLSTYSTIVASYISIANLLLYSSSSSALAHTPLL